VVKVSIIRFELNCLRKGFDGVIEISLAIQTDTFVVVSECICWIDTDGRRIVLDSAIELTDLIESEAPVKKGFEVIRHNFEGPCILINGGEVVTLLSRGIALRVKDFRLLLSLLLVERQVS
jgi:hypothetical protein